jgi:hypothetical protein
VDERLREEVASVGFSFFIFSTTMPVPVIDTDLAAKKWVGTIPTVHLWIPTTNSCHVSMYNYFMSYDLKI